MFLSGFAKLAKQVGKSMAFMYFSIGIISLKVFFVSYFPRLSHLHICPSLHTHR